MESTPFIPCRRGHTSPRNRFGQCPDCLRETRRTYNKRRPKAARPVPVTSQVIAVAPEPPATPAGPAPGTFLAVAQEWIGTLDSSAPKTVTKRSFLLAQLKKLHDRPIAEITTPDVVRVLKEIEAIGDRRESAHRAGGLAAQITRYATQHGYTTVNVLPEGQLRGALKPRKVESHAAITDPKLFGELLHNIDLYVAQVRSRNHPSVTAALQLAPLIFLRPSELRGLEWSEVSFEKAEMLIAPERMKMKKAHVVPLSTQALVILRAQFEKSGTGRFVFPQKNGRERPMSENAFREAMRIIQLLAREEDKQSMHGFRASASTFLNQELRFDSEIIELQLAHQRSGVRGIYDRSQRLDERRSLMQRWSDYCAELKASASKEAT